MISAFKSLNRKDVFLSEYVSKKHWTIWSSEFGIHRISKVLAISGSLPYYPVSSDLQNTYYGSTDSKYYPRLAYEGLKCSFYTGSQKDGTFIGPFKLDFQTSVTVSGSRDLHDNDVVMYSIPRECIGNRIEKGSIKLSCSGSSFTLTDVEGVLVSGSQVLGDVIYDKGLLIITDSSSAAKFKASSDEYLEYNSELPIYTHNIVCPVDDLEFNSTYNPSAKDLIGDSRFTPYVTTIGLYNQNHELMAVAKLSKPVRKTSDVDMSFIVNIDIG